MNGKKVDSNTIFSSKSSSFNATEILKQNFELELVRHLSW